MITTKKIAKSKKGGTRAGAGRPRREDAIHVHVYIDIASVDFFKKLGQGKGKKGEDSTGWGMDEAVRLLKGRQR